MEKRTRIGEVSFVTDIACEHLRARKTWQFLFDYYRNNGGDLSRMDNLLVDLKCLTDFFVTYPVDGEVTRFRWTFYRWSTAFTSDSNLFGEEWCIEGVWRWESRAVELFLIEEVSDGDD